MEVLDQVTIISMGMMVGVEFAVMAFVNPTVSKLNAEAEAHATRLFAGLLGRVMPFWYVFCLLSMLAETVLRYQTAGFWPAAAASGIWVAVIVLTLLFLVPINNRIAKMSPDGYNEELRRQHRNWDRGHQGRVFLLLVALVLLLHAVFL